MSLNKKMGDAHEQRMAAAFGGRMTRGSGNQFKDQMDGKHDRLGSVYAFAWDGKSTRGGTNSVTLAMWQKAELQAQDRRPMLGLCWYLDDRLRSYVDLVVMRQDDAVAMRDDAVKLHQMREVLTALADGAMTTNDLKTVYEGEDEVPTLARYLLELTA